MFIEFPDVVGVPELCRMLNIGSPLAYRLLNDKVIISRKIGREYKILKSHVIDYLKNIGGNKA